MLDLLRSRRSIRKYTGEGIGPEQRAALEEAALRAPSSHGRRPWEFVFVEERALLERLARAKPTGSAFLSGAALAVAVCGDEPLSDVWIEDCAVAAAILHFTAHDLGLGSCWVQVRNRPHDETRSAEEYVRDLLGIPDRLRVLCMVGIGVPAEPKAGVPREALPFEKIHYDRFGRNKNSG